MTWCPVTLADLRPMQTIRVNGRLAVRVHAIQRQDNGLLLVVTDLGETLMLTSADHLLRLDKSAAREGDTDLDLAVASPPSPPCR